MRRNIVTNGLAAVLMSLAAAGCSDVKDGYGIGPVASTAAPVQSDDAPVATPGATVATPATNTNTAPPPPPPPPPPADLTAPAVAVVSPQRGLQTTSDQVLVEADVSDAESGIDYVLIANDLVIPDANGRVQSLVSLDEGMNFVTIEVADMAGNLNRAHIPVCSGQFLPDGQRVQDAALVRLNQGAFDQIEQLANAQLNGQFLSNAIMARNPLFETTSGVLRVRVEPRAASFGNPTVSIEPSATGLQVSAVVNNVDIETRIRGRLAWLVPLNLQTDVTADRVTLTATANATVGPNGAVTTTLANVNVAIDNFRFNIRYVPGFIENLARNRVRRLIEDKVEELIDNTVPGVIDNALAGAIQPTPFNVLGQQITIDLAPSLVTIDADGATVGVHGDVVLGTPSQNPNVLGSFLTGAAGAPVLDRVNDVQVAANVDLLNRLAYGVWRGNLVDLTLTPSSIPALGQLPIPLTLDGFFLMQVFPQLQGMLNATDEVEAQITVGAAPVFGVLTSPDDLGVEMADLTITLKAGPANQPKQVVCRLGIQVRANVDVTLATNTLMVEVTGSPVVLLDLYEAPLAPMSAVELQNFVDLLLPTILQRQTQLWSGIPLPVLPGLTPSNVQLDSFEREQFFAVKGDL